MLLNLSFLNAEAYGQLATTEHTGQGGVGIETAMRFTMEVNHGEQISRALYSIYEADPAHCHTNPYVGESAEFSILTLGSQFKLACKAKRITTSIEANPLLVG